MHPSLATGSDLLVANAVPASLSALSAGSHTIRVVGTTTDNQRVALGETTFTIPRGFLYIGICIVHITL